MSRSYRIFVPVATAMVSLGLGGDHPPWAVAAAMQNHIQEVRPRIIERGKVTEVTIRGICLDDVEEVVFYKPGITTESIFKTVPITQRLTPVSSRIEEEVKCRFVVAADAPLGEHPFRIRTKREITTVATIHVGPYPILDEAETFERRNTNDKPGAAMPVPLNVTVRGQMEELDWTTGFESPVTNAGDVDVFRVPVKAGQRLAAEVACARLTDVVYGSPGHDLALRILDAQGRILAANDNNPLLRQDPLTAIRVERDGFLFVEVRRPFIELWRREYCVHIGSRARPVVAYPPGGQTGAAIPVKLLGDPLGPIDAMVAMPAEPRVVDYYGDAPSPVLLKSFAGPNVLEPADGGAGEVAELPAALNGIIHDVDDRDAFRLRVKKTDRLRLRVFATSLGSPLDPMLRIYPIEPDGTRGPVEVEADDAKPEEREIYGIRSGSGCVTDVLDPSVVWEPKRAGLYEVEIADSSASAGPLAVYRVECEPAPDAIHTALESTSFNWQECIRASGMAVSKGNRWTVNLSLPTGQGNRYTGPLEIFAEGLPPGVKIVSPALPAWRAVWPIQLVAAESAIPGTRLVKFGVRPVDGRPALATSSQQNIPMANLSGGDAWHIVRLDRYMVAVTQPARYSIAIEPPQFPAVRGGEMPLRVKVTRAPGFDGPVEIACDYRPPGINTVPVIIPSGVTEGDLILSVSDETPEAPWPIAVVATDMPEYSDAQWGVGRQRVSSEIIEISVKAPLVWLTAPTASVRRGERLRYEWTVKQGTHVPGEAIVTLAGLPKGVTTVGQPQRLSASASTVAFEVEASEEALLGPVKGIHCLIRLTVGNQEIRTRAGWGTLRIDPARAKNP